MDDPEFVTRKDADAEKCADCKFYISVDSGYGFCRRFPPKWERLGRWWRPKWQVNYQLVGWYRKACGEFKRKG